VDNVTHTLIGLIAGESVAAETRPSAQGLAAPARRALLVGVAVIGSNTPDLDLLVSFSGGPSGNLDYMLRHRGYTHTVLGCLALALILYGCAEAWLRYRRLEPSRRDRGLLLAVAIFATGLHLVMDYLNSYGVHPFWPVENRWSYGDSVFIVEPLYWVAAAPLLCSLRSRFARLVFALALVAIVAVGALGRLLTPASCILLAASALTLVFLGSRVSLRSAARVGAALWLGVTLTFILAGRSAASRAEALARDVFPHDRILDRVLAPLPANPLCWDLLLLEAHGDRYVARHAMLTLAPDAVGARECPILGAEEHTAPLGPVGAADTEGVRWLGEFEIVQQALAERVAASCDAQAFMLFARAPFLAETVLGDLRFDRGRERGSFEVPLAAMKKVQSCGRAAPWSAPRADLLDIRW
jgi:inner membrane protein